MLIDENYVEIGQVMGVALSAAVFQSVLNAELHKRIPDDEEVRRFRLADSDRAKRCSQWFMYSGRLSVVLWMHCAWLYAASSLPWLGDREAAIQWTPDLGRRRNTTGQPSVDRRNETFRNPSKAKRNRHQDSGCRGASLPGQAKQ